MRLLGTLQSQLTLGMPLRKTSAKKTLSATLLMELFRSQAAFIDNLHNNFTIIIVRPLIITITNTKIFTNNYKTTTKSLKTPPSNN